MQKYIYIRIKIGIMKLITINEAQQHLDPYLTRFGDCYYRTLNHFQIVASAFNGPMNKRTKPTIFHNLLLNEITGEFGRENNIKFFPEFETLTSVINDRIATRFKKLDENRQPSNKETARNNALVSQQGSLFSDSLTITLLDFGYSINESWTDFNFISVGCNLNGVSVWSISITREGGATILSSINNNPLLPDDSESGSTWIFNVK